MLEPDFTSQDIRNKHCDTSVSGTPYPDYDYIARSITGDDNYPEDACPLYLQVNGKFDNLKIIEQATTKQLNVSGISTLGVTTTTNLTAKQLNVSGITTSSGGISNGTNTLSFTVAGSNLTLTVAGVGSTTLKLF